MASLSMYSELRDVQPHLLTRKEYAVLVSKAAQKVIKQYIQERNQARAELDAWCKANPGPEPKKFGYSQVNGWSSPAAQDRYLQAHEDHQGRWGHIYQDVYNLATSVAYLKRTILLARIIEDGRYDKCREDSSFWMYFGGVNNTLMNHGQDVFRALYHHIDVPEHVLAEWPEGVAQVREEMARMEAWDKANPEYAHL